MTEGERITGEFHHKPTSKEILRDAIDFLDDVSYKFALFTDGFKRFLKEEGLINETKTRPLARENS